MSSGLMLASRSVEDAARPEQACSARTRRLRLRRVAAEFNNTLSASGGAKYLERAAPLIRVFGKAWRVRGAPEESARYPEYPSRSRRVEGGRKGGQVYGVHRAGRCDVVDGHVFGYDEDTPRPQNYVGHQRGGWSIVEVLFVPGGV